MQSFNSYIKAYDITLDPSTSLELFKQNLDIIVQSLVKHSNTSDTAYFQLFLERRYLKQIVHLLQTKHFAKEYFKIIFHNIEVLMKGFKSTEQIQQLIKNVHTHLIDEQSIKYNFLDQQNSQYYILIIRSLVHEMTVKNGTLIHYFVNNKHPHFPIVYNSMKFYNSKEEDVSTVSKYIISKLSAPVELVTPYLKKYFINFPFVNYIANYVFYMRDLFNKAIQQNKFSFYLISQIEFIQEYVAYKDFETINMYSNAFFHIFVSNLVKSLHQNPAKTLKFFSQILKPEKQERIKVQKILIGLRRVFSVQIQSALLSLLNQNTVHNESYTFQFRSKTFLDQNISYIKQHCSRLLNQNYQNQSRSLIRGSLQLLASTLITTSRKLQNHLYNLSLVLGVRVELNNEINHDILLQDRYLEIMNRTQNPKISNPIYNSLIQQCLKDQQIYFYYLHIVKHLKIFSDSIVPKIKTHLNMLSQCLSLPILFIFYRIMVSCPVEYNQQELEHIHKLYEKTIQKLLSYIMEQGSENLIKSGLGIVETTQYYDNIQRMIECDIVLLHILRRPLKIQVPQLYTRIETVFPKKKMTKKEGISCRINDSQEDIYTLNFFNQYFAIYNINQDQIYQRLIKNYKVYLNANMLQFMKQSYIQDETPQGFTLYFQNAGLAEYTKDKFNELKYKISACELELHSLRFDILK